MDEFDKWLDYRKRDNGIHSVARLEAGIALDKYHSMKKTCKMTSFFVGDGDVRWECSNCRETMKNPDKYCTHCGAEVIE